MISDGYTEAPPGKIAAVVTYLEMRERPARAARTAPEGLRVRREEQPNLESYRRVFRDVGEPWLWFSRLRLDDAALANIIRDPRVDLFFLEESGAVKGILELDRREMPDIELAFFGLTPDIIGRGAGRFLMDFALDEVWARQPRRFFLHTCTNDHPGALAFYLRSGFRAYKRGIEVGDDPRLTGHIARSFAPHVPLIEP